jgi:hypothetical protein
LLSNRDETAGLGGPAGGEQVRHLPDQRRIGRGVLLRMAFEQPGGQAGDGREQYVIEFVRTGRAHRHARWCRAGSR